MALWLLGSSGRCTITALETIELLREALADAGWDKNGRKHREERTGVSGNRFHTCEEGAGNDVLMQ